VRALPATVLAAVVLLWNVHHGLQRSAPRLADFPARYFADVSVATHLYLRGEYPVASYRVRRAAVNPRGDQAFTRYVSALEEATRAAGATPARPFATAGAPGGDDERMYVRRRDDSGRAYLLGLAFRVLGGVAPYLLFWMAPLLAVAVLGWIAFETAAAGWTVAGQVFVALLALSAYVTDLLALAYSPAGFYLVGVMALAAYAAYAFRAHGVTLAGVMGRTTAAGAVVAVCALCRSGTLVLVPFFVAAAFVALRHRLGPPAAERSAGVWVAAPRGARREVAIPRWAAALAAASAVLIGPYLACTSVTAAAAARTAAAYSVTAEPQDHDVWISVWEGLGDFDRTHGFVWDDIDAQVAVGDWRLGTLRSAEILRDQVLLGVRRDPSWYAGILARRTLATLTQWKLLPWAPLGGRSIRPRSAHNEGAIDSYYALTSNLDWFRAGPLRFEVPVPLFWVAVLAAFVLAFRGREPAARAAGPALALVLVATLALPVAVTTAGALETQAVAVAYFLAVGLAVDLGLRARRIMP
jgi:hypothetical protein